MKKTNRIKKPELLAPAGDLERLKWAIHYGADAVYCGGSLYGLRANATNFTLEEIEEGVCYAHERGKRVYITVNIALHDDDVVSLITYLQALEARGVDAIIVSDPTVLSLAHQHTQLEIHLSTQQSTLNWKAVSFWKQQGVTRIVLGRETSAEEIQAILEHVDIEIECFIHGAMCSSYSGRCVLSNFLTARDANRGGCSQICRWDFNLTEPDGTLLQGDTDFTLCTKDLSMLRYLGEMMDLGITAFKIEGRMRSIYYVATVVDAYRRAIDAYNQEHDQYLDQYERILRRCANRDAVPQFFHHESDENCQYYLKQGEQSNQDFLGVVLAYDEKTKQATIEERNYFEVGDTVTFFGPEIEPTDLVVTNIWDEDGPITVVRHAQQVVTMEVPFVVYPNNLMRIQKKVDKTINS